MDYFYIEGNQELFVLFHGTGGNDTSLLFLTGELNPQASVLSFSGNVGVGQARRFFAPLENWRVNRGELSTRVAEFLAEWDTLGAITEGKRITFVGYSNGANFILALLERRPDIADRTLLLHPSELGWQLDQVAKRNQLVMTLGANDYIAPAGPMIQLAKRIAGTVFPTVETLLLDGSHGIVDEEIEQLRAYLKQQDATT